MQDKLFDVSNIISPLSQALSAIKTDVTEMSVDVKDSQEEIKALYSQIRNISDSLYLNLNLSQEQEDFDEIDEEINLLILNDFKKVKAFPKLDKYDIFVCGIAGVISVIMDFLLVGTPEIVKIYKGGERFDGSILTKAIRNVGNEKIKPFTDLLCSKFRVPYDISAIPDGMYPQNHRLRNLAHDPIFGLLFAIFDIRCNTTTFIDDSGFLRIVENTKYHSTLKQKIFPVFYYLGHILSDFFTARGIPIPGFFTTQFFRDGASDSSIASIAEDMYLNGYDSRHLLSMSTPVLAKTIIIESYLRIKSKSQDNTSISFVEKEISDLNKKIKKEKMLMIADSIAVTGNLVKIFAPPYCGNPCSINIAEWIDFIAEGIKIIKIANRDKSTEQILSNRDVINENWELLKHTIE